MTSWQKYGSSFSHQICAVLLKNSQSYMIKPLTPTLHFVVGALNGIFGDFFLKQHILCITNGALRSLWIGTKGELTGAVVILAHGLCMNHLTWSNHRYGGTANVLAHNVITTIFMLYLNYNTGRRIWPMNGRSYANVLEDLERNPRIPNRFDWA